MIYKYYLQNNINRILDRKVFFRFRVKSLLIFCFYASLIGVFFIIGNSGANQANLIDEECKNNGFDFGVAKWKCEEGDCSADTWLIETEIFPGTNVSGSCDSANWDVASSSASGIIVATASSTYKQVGLNGTAHYDGKNIQKITFCGVNGINACGNSNIDSGEECDNAAQNGQSCDASYGANCTYCSSTCQNITITGAFCGDGVKNGIEECDKTDGIAIGQTCSDSCKILGDSCRANLDVIIVLDVSGSMTKDIPPRLTQAKEASINFLDRLDSIDQSGLVFYSTHSTLDKLLSNNHSDTKNAISALSAGGATNIGDAISDANQELISSRAKTNNAKIEILLTDGRANKPNGSGFGEDPADVAYAENKADIAASSSIKIFTIGLGTEVNDIMLKNIANKTGGEYYYSPTSNDLNNIFNQIGYKICQYGSISGCKYLDANNDGIIAGENKIPNWEIKLSGASNSIKYTDNNGCFSFTGLLAGNYTISEATSTTGYIQTYPQGNGSYNINLGEGENKENADFGNYLSACGNNIVDAGEQCDNGQTNGQTCTPPYGGSCNYCSGTCQTTTLNGPNCGDGVKNGTEQCDGTDGVGQHQTCTQTCTLQNVPYCGDGVKNGTEQCDGLSGTPPHYTCKQNCTLEYIPYCGDGIKNGLEQCDGIDGVGQHQVCTVNCALKDEPYCGDSLINNCEECDNGLNNGKICSPAYGNNCTYCSALCNNIIISGPKCGDGTKNGPEECDDGNLTNGDGCNLSCKIEIVCNLSSISGYKYKDDDGLASTTADRVILSGWLIELFYSTATSTPIATTTTNSLGFYKFNNLNIGNYLLVEAIKAGWSQVSAPDSTINVSCGSNLNGYNFINYQLPAASCGDDIKNESEECDMGMQNGQVCTPAYGGSCNYCSNACQNISLTGPKCGDGVKNGLEECDGNSPNYDYKCTDLCKKEVYGAVIIYTSNSVSAPAGNPILKIIKTINQIFANPGDEVEYFVKILNEGSLTAKNVVMDDNLPPSFSFTEGGGTKKSFIIGDLVPGANKVISYKVKISDTAGPKVYVNTAQAKADNHIAVQDDAGIEVRAVEVFGSELVPTGFSIKEFIILLTVLFLSALGLFALKRKSAIK